MVRGFLFFVESKPAVRATLSPFQWVTKVLSLELRLPKLEDAIKTVALPYSFTPRTGITLCTEWIKIQLYFTRLQLIHVNMVKSSETKDSVWEMQMKDQY
jgi:hypothetical protein